MAWYTLMNKQQAIDNIMDNFDFYKVWKMMQHNKDFWIHHAVDNSESVLRVWVREQLQSLDLVRDNYETGGFAFKYEVDGGHYMSLQFIGESWDNYWD